MDASWKEKQIDSVLSIIPDPVIIVTMEGRIKKINSPFVKLFGIKEEDILEKIIWEHKFLTEDAIRSGMNNIARRMRGEDVPAYEIAINLDDNIERFVEINGTRLEYEGGLADMVILHDITRIRQADKTLRSALDELRESSIYRESLLNNMAEGLGVLDLEGTCMDANPSLLRMLGLGTLAFGSIIIG